jgi:hypothetical protein
MKAKILILILTIISTISSAQEVEFFEHTIYLDNPLIPRAKLLIDLKPDQTEITRPFIIAEGFDSGSITNPETEYGDTDLISFQKSLFPEAGNNLNDMINPTDINQEYDIIYVNWTNGTNDIKENSKVLKSEYNG